MEEQYDVMVMFQALRQLRKEVDAVQADPSVINALRVLIELQRQTLIMVENMEGDDE